MSSAVSIPNLLIYFEHRCGFPAHGPALGPVMGSVASLCAAMPPSCHVADKHISAAIKNGKLNQKSLDLSGCQNPSLWKSVTETQSYTSSQARATHSWATWWEQSHSALVLKRSSRGTCVPVFSVMWSPPPPPLRVMKPLATERRRPEDEARNPTEDLWTWELSGKRDRLACHDPPFRSPEKWRPTNRLELKYSDLSSGPMSAGIGSSTSATLRGKEVEIIDGRIVICV